MGAAGSKRPCDKLVDACTSLDVAHDVAEVVSLFRAAVQGACASAPARALTTLSPKSATSQSPPK